jgi:hypothetical protein
VTKFFQSRSEKVTNSDQFKLKKVPANVRSKGKFSSYTDPSTGEFKVYKFLEENEDGGSTYSL